MYWDYHGVLRPCSRKGPDSHVVSHVLSYATILLPIRLPSQEYVSRSTTAGLLQVPNAQFADPMGILGNEPVSVMGSPVCSVPSSQRRTCSTSEHGLRNSPRALRASLVSTLPLFCPCDFLVYMPRGQGRQSMDSLGHRRGRARGQSTCANSATLGDRYCLLGSSFLLGWPSSENSTVDASWFPLATSDT